MSGTLNLVACTQQVSDSLLFFLISAASAEVVSKVSKTNAPRLRTCNTKPRSDTNTQAERTSLEFK